METRKLLVIFPIVSLLIYFGAGIFYDSADVIFIKPFIIPSFLLYAIAINHKKLTIGFYLFLIFFYLGEMFILFEQKSAILLQLGLINLIFCYSLLVFLSKGVFIRKKIDTIFQGFTLIIFLVNSIVLSAILFVLLEQIQNVFTDVIVIFNAMVAVIVGVVAALYVSENASTKAFFYFFGAYSLILSDVIGALDIYYFESLLLNTIGRLLHFVAIYLIYLFCIDKSN